MELDLVYSPGLRLVETNAMVQNGERLMRCGVYHVEIVASLGLCLPRADSSAELIFER